MRVAPICMLGACGSKTGLDVPPLLGCEGDASVPESPLRCDSFVLGDPRDISAPLPEPGFDSPLVGVDSIEAVPHAGGAVIVYQFIDEREGVVGIRVLALDAEGQPSDDSPPLLSLPTGSSTSLTQPGLVSWGCGYAALGGLLSAHVGREVAGCVVSIARDGAAPLTIDAGGDFGCRDLHFDGERLSWVSQSGSGHALQYADLGGERSSDDLRGLPHGALNVDWPRVQLPDGGYLLAQRGAYLGPGRYEAGGTLARLGRGSGTVQSVEPLTDRFLVDFLGAADDRSGTTWIVWSEADEPNARHETAEALAGTLDPEGQVTARVVLDADGRVSSRFGRPLWLGRRLVLALREPSSLATLAAFDETGAQVTSAPLSDDAHAVALTPVPGGALILYIESRYVEGVGGSRRSTGSVLVSRTLRCAG